MYATTLEPLVSSSPSSPSTFARLRASLDAVYRRRSVALNELARLRVRNRADAADAVQNAVLYVLEHPPADLSERSLGAALEAAVRAACDGRHKARRDDVALKIALRKRFPVG